MRLLKDSHIDNVAAAHRHDAAVSDTVLHAQAAPHMRQARRTLKLSRGLPSSITTAFSANAFITRSVTSAVDPSCFIAEAKLAMLALTCSQEHGQSLGGAWSASSQRTRHTYSTLYFRITRRTA